MFEQHTRQTPPVAGPVLPQRTFERRVWAAQRDLVRESLVRLPQGGERRTQR
jgi:hypothetical protein